MKIPNQVRIAGVQWSVLMSSAVDKVLDADKRLGLAVFDTSEIYLKSHGRSQEAIWEVFLHELVHIVLHNAGQTQMILKEDDVEEAIVESLGCGLFQIFHDNGMLSVEEEV